MKNLVGCAAVGSQEALDTSAAAVHALEQEMPEEVKGCGQAIRIVDDLRELANKMDTALREGSRSGVAMVSHTSCEFWEGKAFYGKRCLMH